MVWVCEHCDKEFENEKECENHEKKCEEHMEKEHKKSVQRNILVTKWIIFGVMLCFGILTFTYRWFFAGLGILMALFFMPTIENLLIKKYKFNIHFVLKCLILFLFFVFFFWTIPSCGDNSCNGNEDSLSCVGDCGSVCDDEVCNGEETSCSCVEDCGECASSGKICEESVCEADECVTIVKDNCCGNGVIEEGENCFSCEADVSCSLGEVCSSSECIKLDWSCSDWSDCGSDGLQTRKCVEGHGLVDNKPEESQACEYIPSIGDSLIVGNFEYILKSVDTEDYVAGSYFVAEANGIYYILEFEITNIGKEQDTIPLSQILIVDSENREYSYDAGATNYLYDGIGSWEDLNPGISISGSIAYDVPKGLTGEIKIGDGDLWEPTYKLFRLEK